MAVTKVGTCCYCGTKAALVLRGAERHELSCKTCGAPLHALKILPQKPQAPKAKKAVSHRPLPTRDTPSRPGKRKKRKSFKKRVWEEVWDALEDIFD